MLEDIQMRTLRLLLLSLALLLALSAACARSGAVKLVACPVCGGKVEASTLKAVDGKQMCEACADRLHPPPAAADAPGRHTCAACGMVMAEADMAQDAGKWYCRHCLPAPAAAPAAPGGS
jgi:formylmethanofuran dehydrogenase subunit E